jgi:hypothetical protein
MWFTNIYVIIVAAVLAYLGGIGIEVANVMYMPLVVFLLMFSILSFIIVSKLSSEFESHIRKLKEILNENKPDLEKYAVVPLNKGIWKYLKIRRAFIWFYLLNIALWICLIFLPLIINYARSVNCLSFSSIFPHA